MTELTLTIEGMSCGHCVKHVTRALAAVPGVRVKEVAVGRAVVEVEADGGAAAEPALVQAVADAGYTARATQL